MKSSDEWNWFTIAKKATMTKLQFFYEILPLPHLLHCNYVGPEIYLRLPSHHNSGILDAAEKKKHLRKINESRVSYCCIDAVHARKHIFIQKAEWKNEWLEWRSSEKILQKWRKPRKHPKLQMVLHSLHVSVCYVPRVAPEVSSYHKSQCD